MKHRLGAGFTAIAWIAPTVVFVGIGYARRWVSDDAFINFRIVQNLLEGHGPVFNVAERVEAYSNPLWMFVLTVWAWLGAPLETGSVWLGLLLAGAGLAAAQHGAYRLHRFSADGAGGYAVPLGVLLVLGLPPFWDFATSGLETGMVLAWLGGAYWLLVDASISNAASGGVRRRDLVAAFVIGLGTLVRPDLGIFCLFFLLGFVVVLRGRRCSWGRIAILLVIAGGLPVVYQVFRMGYFAALVPNTALAKEAGLSHWSQGWVFLLDFVMPYWLFVPLVVCFLFSLRFLKIGTGRETWPLVALPVLAALLSALFVVRMGGGFMHGRFFLPVVFGLMLPVATVLIPASGRRAVSGWSFFAVVLVWTVVSGFVFRVPYEGEIGNVDIADERGFYVRTSKRDHPITLEDYQDHIFASLGRSLIAQLEAVRTGRVPPGPYASGIVLIDSDNRPNSPHFARPNHRIYPKAQWLPGDVLLVVGRWNIGITGYLAGSAVQLVDRRGLSDPIASRLRVVQRGRPGHEKQLNNAWIIARFSPVGEGESNEVITARNYVESAPLRELLAAIEEPLTPERFWKNVLLAPKFHRLRLP